MKYLIPIIATLLLTSCSNYNRLSFSKVKKDKTEKQPVAAVKSEKNKTDLFASQENPIKEENKVAQTKVKVSPTREMIAHVKRETKKVNNTITNFSTKKLSTKKQSAGITLSANMTTIQGRQNEAGKGLAIASILLLLGNIILPVIASLAGLILGCIAFNQSRSTVGSSTKTLSIVGIVLNLVVIILVIVIIIALATGKWSMGIW